jgi:hypothetical protein
LREGADGVPSDNPTRDDTDRPLEGKDALQLYIARIMSNVDELSQQAEFLEQALENMKRLQDELEAIRKMGV